MNTQTESEEIQQSVRFVIQDEDERCGLIWGLWSTGEYAEIYLSNNLVGGFIKAVFCSEGEWQIYNQIKLSEKASEPRDSPKTNFFYSWPKPKELIRGMTDLFTIITPSFALSPNKDFKFDEVLSIPNCSAGYASRTDIISVAPQISTNRLFEWGQGSFNPVASFVLSNEHTIWVVNQEVELPDLSQASKGIGLSLISNPGSAGGTASRRTLVVLELKEGVRIIGDYVFGKKNKS